MEKLGSIPQLSFSILLLLSLLACQKASQDLEHASQTATAKDRLFTVVSPQSSGIDFQNELIETESANYYKYMYSYIGGGVAAADFNNDDLVDLFFISNTKDNKLYLNQGDFKFKDVTQAAGIEKRPGFDAGVTVADVNNDGWLDIYISRGGWKQENDAFANMLYINNGANQSGPTFTESAKEYGLADANRAIQSTFFDYDRDGDLDLYLSNTPDFEDKAAEVVDLIEAQTDPKTFALKGMDKLYNNDGNGHFTDVSEQAGIMPDIGFGLNPQVGDLNNDGWLDIYVCNDFRIPDFAYINNGNGTFREGRNELLKHMSFNSMGGDIGDLNNDGLLDLYTLDMNPEDYIRSKTTMAMTSVDLFENMVYKNYHHQYMHNMLQINNGNGTFREIANMAGVANTDWSWSCLLADFDLDGYQDIYVTNGVFRDVIDRDKNREILELLRRNQRKPTDKDFLTFAKMLPQQKLTNYFFKNNGDLTFDNVSSSWTDSIPSFSNGAVYADLDNDGDLDVVVNNINEAATVLKNSAIERATGNYLLVDFNGPEGNKTGLGTTATLRFSDGSLQTRQLISSRGFLSSVPHSLHFGLGANETVASLEIKWPDGKIQRMENISISQRITINYEAAQQKGQGENLVENTLFKKVNFDYSHTDPSFNDFQKQILLPHKLSQTGPALAKADVNGDGLEDVYIGGGHTQAGQLLIADKKGNFKPKSISDFQRDRQREDVSACFFDADNDGDSDLYVVSGSYEFNLNSRMLLDRLYLNDGRGNFSKTRDLLPPFVAAGAVVRPADFDQDGDIDLFVGSRVVPGQYPFPAVSYLLINNQGRFTIETPLRAPELEQIGMVTDAVWEDMDGDNDPDLIVTGEWMGIEVFTNENGKLLKSDQYESLRAQTGWWNKLVVADIDSDGDKDIIAGNLGLNYKIHASPKKPFRVYADDFDYNGSVDIMLAKLYKDTEVPVRGRTCTSQQMPHLANKIPTFEEFANSDIEGIIGPDIELALHYEIIEFRSGIFYNNGDEAFSFKPFPHQAQEAPVNSIIYKDFDGDQQPDLLLAGNNHMAEVETTRWDAGIGLFLKGKAQGQFEAVSHLKSGFFANKDVRNMLPINTASETLILVVNNNDQHDLFKVNSGPDI